MWITAPASTPVTFAGEMFRSDGGGYAYRICKADGNVTEECFQAGHLEFVGETSFLQTQPPRPASGVSHDPDHPTGGLCGITPSFAGCNTSTTSGSFHARSNGVSNLAECAIFILTQKCGQRARYVSFSQSNDDCSWYEACSLAAHEGYTSVAIRPTPSPPPSPVNISRVEIPRVTVSTGTFPSGSMWARCPIPACRYTGPQRMASDPQHHTWINCTAADCASCCEHPVRRHSTTTKRLFCPL